MLVHEQAEWPSDVPLIEAIVVVPDRPTAHQQLEDRRLTSVEADQSGSQAVWQQEVERPASDETLVRTAHDTGNNSPDHLPQSHAPGDRPAGQPPRDGTEPRAALRRHYPPQQVIGRKDADIGP